MTQSSRLYPIDGTDQIPALERIDQHSKTLDRAVRLTQMADAKTAPVLALQATVAAVTVTQSGALGDLLDLDGNIGLVALALLLLAIYTVAALFAVVLGIFVYLPRAPTTARSDQHEPLSLVYFDDIRRMAPETFRSRAITVDMETFERDLLTQVHTVSGVAALKMGYVRRALQLTVLTFLAWLPLIAWAQA